MTRIENKYVRREWNWKKNQIDLRPVIQIKLKTAKEIKSETACQVQSETVVSAELTKMMTALASDTWQLFMRQWIVHGYSDVGVDDGNVDVDVA